MKKSNYKVSLLQYIMIYLMLSCGGMAVAEVLSNDVFSIMMILISLFLIYFYKSIEIYESKFMGFIAILFLLLLMNVYSTGLTLGTSLNVISPFLILYATIKIDPYNYVNRLIKVILIIAIVSLIIFFIQYFWGINSFSSVFPFLHSSIGSNETVNYGGFIYRFVPFHENRNCGPFGEPGKFQGMLAVALFFILFKKGLYTDKKRFHFATLLIVTLLSTMSTTGYISLFILILCFIIKNLKKESFYIRKRFLIVMSLIIGLFLFTDFGEDIWRVAITEKIDTNNLTIKGSGVARSSTIIDVFKVIDNNISTLWGIGYDKMYLLGIDGCAGLFGILLAIGIIPYVFTFGYTFKKAIYYSKPMSDGVVCILLLINFGLGQPHIMNPLMFSLLLYPYLSRNNTIYSSQIKA